MSAAEKRYQDALMVLNQGRFSDAERQFRRVLKDHPSNVGALNLLTVALMSMKRFAEAEPVIARALKLNQNSDVSFYNYGLILKHLGKSKQAAEQFSHALRLNPTVADTWNNRGAARHDVGQYESAVADFDKAIVLNPNDPAAYLNKCRSLTALQRYDEALAANDQAIAINSGLAEAWLGRGAVLTLIERYDDAFAAYQKALALKPELAAAHSGIGKTLHELGRLDEARKAYLKALTIEPACGEFYGHYVSVKKVVSGDPRFAAMEALCADDAAPRVDRMCANFALGKACADIADHERAFTHWLRGAALKREQIDYDEAKAAAQFEDVAHIFTPALIAEKSGHGDPSTRPIFVLGMPRSGTTLVEQILASHPDVHGAGELIDLSDILGAASDADGTMTPYPQYVAGLGGTAIRELGARYIARLSRLAPDARHVTDKMPGNFHFLGMIHLALPNATIIHSIRNPVDTCLSCFSNLFAHGQEFSYDLGELGRYYGRYQRLMKHWHQVLPPGKILDVRYEDVVADLEGQARRILGHCGLAWDARCLDFNKSDRPVRTVSAAQVRQPIYSHSVERWRRYEKWLGPLLKELDRAADAP